jgi:hypothetical protein
MAMTTSRREKAWEDETGERIPESGEERRSLVFGWGIAKIGV